MGLSDLHKRLLVLGAAVVLVPIAAAVYFGLSTWGEVNRVSIERPDSGEISASSTLPADGAEPADASETELGEPVFETDGTDVFLLVGSDSREHLSDVAGFGESEGRRADVIMVVIRSGGEVGVLSLPRDLWVESSCDGESTRLNEELEGCGDRMNGPTLLTVTVERLIGETIDHFALVDLAGFQQSVDAIGGYEICLERAVRDRRANLELPAGCTLASGEQTLAWLRSRHTQELTSDGWRIMPGVNDLARNERQRAFLIEMMGRLSDFSSPQSLAETAKAIAEYITVDSELSLLSAVDLAWTLRGIGEGHVTELEVPVLDHTTDNGAAVLIASTPVRDVVAEFLTLETAGETGSVVES